MIGGAMSKPNNEPTSRPPKAEVTAFDRWLGGTPFANTPVAADGATPSPRPTKNLDASNAGMPSAAHHGAMSVPNDQSMTPQNKTALPPYLLANHPPGICVNE